MTGRAIERKNAASLSESNSVINEIYSSLRIIFNIVKLDREELMIVFLADWAELCTSIKSVCDAIGACSEVILLALGSRIEKTA